MPTLPIPVVTDAVINGSANLADFIVNVVSTCGAFAAECNLGSSEYIELFNYCELDATTCHVNIAVPTSVPVVRSMHTVRNDIYYALNILLRQCVSSSPLVEIRLFWVNTPPHRRILRVVIRSGVLSTLTGTFRQLLDRTTTTAQGYSNQTVRPSFDDTTYSHTHKGLIAALNMAIHIQSSGQVSLADIQHQYKSIYRAEIYHGTTMAEFSVRETGGWVRSGVEIANSVNGEADIMLEFVAFAPDRFLYGIKSRSIPKPTTVQKRSSKIQPSLADTLVDLLTDNEHGFLVTVMLRAAEQLSLDHKNSDYEIHCHAVEEAATLLELFPKIFPGGDSVLAEKLNPALAVDAMGLVVRQEMNKDKVRLAQKRSSV